MAIAFDVVSLLFGGLILYLGAEWLVKGSAGMARALGVKPLVIGLTVVAYGTSAPELAVSTAAILEGSSAIVLGNVIGSCVANLGLILGITALISPPAVDGQLIRREVPVMCVAALTVPVMLYGASGQISFIEAGILLAGAVLFTLYTLFVAAPSNRDATTGADLELPEGIAEVPPEEQSKGRLAIITFVGLGLLVGGGDLFVEGAQGIARAIGMSERQIGLTVVAIGTSLPELAASMVAAARGYSSLAVGNVIGSNIFNIFLILGVVGLIRPINGSIGGLAFDLAFLVGTTALGVLFMRGTRRISRGEGALLLGTYITFIAMATLDL